MFVVKQKPQEPVSTDFPRQELAAIIAESVERGITEIKKEISVEHDLRIERADHQYVIVFYSDKDMVSHCVLANFLTAPTIPSPELTPGHMKLHYSSVSTEQSTPLAVGISQMNSGFSAGAVTGHDVDIAAIDDAVRSSLRDLVFVRKHESPPPGL